MKKIFLTFFLLILISCQSAPITKDVLPIQRLQIVPEPVCKSEYAIDLVECLGFYKNALKRSNNNIEEFLKIYNQRIAK